MRVFEDDRDGQQQAALWRWRLQQARRAGCSQVLAEIVADCELDTHAVLDLARAGCEPELIVELLV